MFSDKQKMLKALRAAAADYTIQIQDAMEQKNWGEVTRNLLCRAVTLGAISQIEEE